ncbi:MAG: sugar kinase [Betaproteobacteria bacterium]|jgi:2-dehydro-3-deoxygluconokinase|nr:sugar kinase [Burkholderiales bacterium]NBX13940.1 sugar kinase [Betaproteobacteria bacterium]NBX89515.1 sugar kinase [Betaproteobacteria bacterium]
MKAALPNDRAWHVLALGEAMVEFNQLQSSAQQYQQGFGGDTSNAVIAAGRAGATTAYLTRCGADFFGDALMQLWRQENVNTQACERTPNAPTGVYFVTHSNAGHAFHYLRAGSAASQMTPHWLTQKPAAPEGLTPAEILKNSKWLHVSGITLAISESACDTGLAAMQMARDAGTQVSFDVNLRLKLWSLQRAQDMVVKAIALSDLFLPSLEDMTALIGLNEPDEILDWSHAQGARQVVLKLGPAGARISPHAQHPEQRQTILGRSVTALDATGAGDCFCGNLLARLAAGDTLPQAARYANAAASLSVQVLGAVQSMPRPQAVMAVLNASAA